MVLQVHNCYVLVHDTFPHHRWVTRLVFQQHDVCVFNCPPFDVCLHKFSQTLVSKPFSSLYDELLLHMLRCPLRSLRTMRECLFFMTLLCAHFLVFCHTGEIRTSMMKLRKTLP